MNLYSQIGNILFEPLYGFESFSRTDATSFAKHDLIGVKPRLQPVGNELEEISISIRFHARFKNPTQAILELKAAKDSYEVLPVLTGSGRFLGDYVITSMTETHNEAFADGELIDASVSLTLQEYAVPDKLQQKQNAARKLGFAVGDKTPVNTGATQKATTAQKASKNVSAVNSESKSVAASSIAWEQNSSQRTYIEMDMQRSLANITTSLNSYSGYLSELASLVPDQTAINAAIQAVAGSVSNFIFPLPSLAILQQLNLALQASNLLLKTANSVIDINVITRKA
jgi:phage protein U